MKIGIDISQTAFKGTGVGRYTEKMIEALIELDQENHYSFLFSSLRQSLDPHLKDLIESDKHSLKEISIPPTLLSLLWNDLHTLPIEMILDRVNVFLSSDWTQPPSKHAKMMTIIHDLIPYISPEVLTTGTTIDFKNAYISPNIVATQKKRLHWVKKECDHIIADSQCTKSDIMKYLHIPEDKITVVYPYVSISAPSKENSEQILQSYNLTKPYLLTVGKLEPRKNIPRLIEAFEQAHLDDLELVIVGADGWGGSTQSQSNRGIHFLGYVSDENLHALYTGAEFFMYPSLYEGFGYPVIEAMALGCPVGTSNVASLKEIAGDNALLFNPENVSDISECIKKLHNSSELRQKLSKDGKHRASTFSKEKYVRNLISVLTS